MSWPRIGPECSSSAHLPGCSLGLPYASSCSLRCLAVGTAIVLSPHPPALPVHPLLLNVDFLTTPRAISSSRSY
ncbi:hypothetical protein HYPSUDRAFT_49321 [Hypholoma sublateritium FD-334 SS-4]|uniref:Uncharacterized protein n=1 Tax=Hypholoma sublateritium (strain FD-334 SS-4) TaxID=945553 RepID=A0A0D2NCH0_HYPSF|nr:hypothetical protein HYPSUDRAFT_49321 [Hypholoma sublateritium FD-334 SS-4]